MKELIFLHLILIQIFRNVFKVSLYSLFQTIFTQFYLFLFLLLIFLTKSFFPIIHHFLPSLVVGILSFLSKLPSIETMIKAKFLICITQLLK